ncbi:MAG TPA: hypothetical protein PL086_06690 [Candidatus Aminicenantes bacterium]|nr:hypothetical protein [Acidobacteriota bacterium]MDD8038896.1 hypothetical protein [Acidobacteriota bacterium]HPH44129.1 hypothetical protein [Candidatus Aminicenantes bacterium]
MKRNSGGRFLAAAVLAGAAGLWAQTEAKTPAFGISFSGFLKTDLIYDSRQTVAIREGHYLLYPKGEAPGPDGRDVNAASSFHMLSVQTRLLGRITGPDAFGAKTSGLIEAEFFGTSDGDLNGFRLRHGFLKLAWPKAELLIGQYWHPMFITDSFPDVVSFNTGAPFQPFNRSPQIRYTRKLGERWSVSAAALAQRDFASTGPEGASTAYARNAAVPEVNLTLQYRRTCEAGCESVFGIGGDYKRIVPRLATTLGYRTDAGLNDWAGMAFGKLKKPGFTVKAEAVYGQNLHHLTMMGGYAAAEITDAVRAEASYAPTENLALWGEIQTNGAAFQAGLFAGYTKNFGFGRNVSGPLYERGADIDAVFRISPRAVYNAGKVRLAVEAEYTAAAYGKTGPDGRVNGAAWVGNLRLLGAVYYFF